MNKIILAGGSGFLGGELAKHFTKLGWAVVVLTRAPKRLVGQASSLPVPAHEIKLAGKMPAPLRVREIAWDAKSLGDWIFELEGATAVVNLTGRSVDCRYNAKNRREIMDSRVNSTRVVGEAIARCKNPPRVWLNSSTATLYQHTFGKAHDESSREMDSATDAKDAFSVEVAQAWERALFERQMPLNPAPSSNRSKTFNTQHSTSNIQGLPPVPSLSVERSMSNVECSQDSTGSETTRRVALRTSMVLGLGNNSVFPVLRRLTKLGLGGRQGSGKQFVSWIHAEDFCRAIEWIITHEELSGPINQCAPNPLPNAEMMKLFREVCHMPIGLPATEWMLEIGAFFLRTETELIFKSRRVVPGKLLASGFEFRFAEFRKALVDLEKKLAA